MGWAWCAWRRRTGCDSPSSSPSHPSTVDSAEEEGQELDFTLVSQTSPDRLWMLAHLCRRWEGPFVLAVYMQDGAFTEVMNDACHGRPLIMSPHHRPTPTQCTHIQAHEAMLAQAPCPNARILRVRPPPRPSQEGDDGGVEEVSSEQRGFVEEWDGLSVWLVHDAAASTARTYT